MLKQLINFYKVSSPGPCNGEALSSSDERRLKYLGSPDNHWGYA